MDKFEYINLLNDAAINDTSKFSHYHQSRKSSNKETIQYFHTLLVKEKNLHSVVSKNLIKEIAG